MTAWSVVRVAAAISCASAAGCGEPTPLPCEVAAVVAEHCGDCHGASRQFGAPMSLTSWDDFHADAPSGDGIAWEVSRARLDDPSRPMPPLGLPVVPADHRAVLAAWFAAGAPARARGEVCP